MWAVYMILAWLIIFIMMGWSISKLMKAEQAKA
ncbi:MAG: hypothetical protein PWP39_375 [Pyrococcus sp.]|nr:hypothetical protein [Pyrococcus sp.]